MSLQNLKITRKKRGNIADILLNFRRHAKEGQATCGCNYIKAKMKKYGWEPPMLDGHVAFIGSKYEGPFKEVLQQNCNNTPIPDYKEDIRMAKALWSQDIKKLPKTWRAKIERSRVNCDGKLNSEDGDSDMLEVAFDHREVDTTTSYKRVKQLKHLLKTMCVTTLDKNGGMLHVCCPKVYETIMDTTFDTVKNGHYEEIRPKKFCEEFAKSSFKDFKQIYYDWG